MEQDIADWKNLWEEEKSSPINLDNLTKQLVKIEKKNKRDRILILITFPFTLIVLATILPLFKSYYYLFSIACICIGMLIILVQLYKSKIKKYSDEKDFNNQEFIKSNIKSLKESVITTSKYMWIYTALFLLGLNIGYIEILKSLDLLVRILIHSGVTLTILLFMYSGIKKRNKKNKKEILPLIDELQNLIN
ncbi:hypothetical protein GTQ40_13880 [Flavobacteriaceae bacterium R38]|nr:hypothetical protein [Flavobacteriaceae bacterium R38]